MTAPAQVVGDAFIEQYYHILHQSPDLVHKFYQDSSILTRPDSNNLITSTTTIQGINEKIISLNYQDLIPEIKTVDAQQSLGDGVVVLVTGYLTGIDGFGKKFAQSFFLAPQEKGYYVLNDVFRYVDDEDKVDSALPSEDGNVENVEVEVQIPEPEQPSNVADLPQQVDELSNEKDLTNEPEVFNPSDIENGSILEEEVVEPPPTHLDQGQDVGFTSVPTVTQEDEPKKSYASILKAMNTNPLPTPARSPGRNVQAKHPSINREPRGAPLFEASASNGVAPPEKLNVVEEAEGYTIYVRSLPQNITVEQLEEVFSKFGPIKRDGIQVRSSKQGFCFGFVEFESLSSMKSAIEASPIVVGTRKTVIEEKRATVRVSGPTSPNNGRGRYPSSRGGPRTIDSSRGRGSFGGGRGYGRNNFKPRGSGSNTG